MEQIIVIISVSLSIAAIIFAAVEVFLHRSMLTIQQKISDAKDTTISTLNSQVVCQRKLLEALIEYNLVAEKRKRDKMESDNKMMSVIASAIAAFAVKQNSTRKGKTKS